MYQLIVEETNGLRGILVLRDNVLYCGKIIKDSRKGDIISQEEVNIFNYNLTKSRLPWYKRIFF